MVGGALTGIKRYSLLPTAYVCFWQKTDMSVALSNVRFRG